MNTLVFITIVSMTNLTGVTVTEVSAHFTLDECKEELKEWVVAKPIFEAMGLPFAVVDECVIYQPYPETNTTTPEG